MRERERDLTTFDNPILLGRQETALFLNMGTQSAVKFAEEAGAVVRYGKRWFANAEKLKAHVNALCE